MSSYFYLVYFLHDYIYEKNSKQIIKNIDVHIKVAVNKIFLRSIDESADGIYWMQRVKRVKLVLYRQHSLSMVTY